QTDRERISSIDEDDGTTEYDVTEHMDMLAHGIPDHFAQKPGPVFIDPEIGDSDEDEVLVYDPQTGEPVEGAEGSDSHTTRVLMKKQVHKRTFIQDGEEKTFITEESQVEQDPDTPDDIRDSMQQIIDEFMENKADPKLPSGESLEDEV
ncbi:hypothetical protein ACJMK2_034761, partial [Sinanodonta woodiana]